MYILIMVFIYVLRLEQNKYYIGKTTNPNFRIESHFNSDGSAWTKLYRPIEVLEIIPKCDEYDENKYTQIYMSKYGIDNVRGGSFVQVKLSNSEKRTLQKIINGTTDKCFICGQFGHFASDCPNTQKYYEDSSEDSSETSYETSCDDSGDDSCETSDESSGSDEVWCCEKCNKEFDTKYEARLHEKKCISQYTNDCCYRCGRRGHYAVDCFAKYHVKGYYIRQ